MGAWDLYDALIEGIDPSVRCTSVTCGHTWTELANDAGSVGLAMTTAGETRPRSSISYRGRTVRELANLVKSWNYLEAGVGMAAINSFYNSEARLEELDLVQKNDGFCTFGLPVEGKRIGVVGHIRHVEEVLAGAASVSVLELSPEKGDYPAPACEWILPECDIVLITGSAFINKTLPRLLELSHDAFTIITGPSAPMAERFANEFAVSRITGIVVTDKPGLHEFVAAGCAASPHRFGKRFALLER